MLNKVSLKDFEDIRKAFVLYKKLESSVTRSEEYIFNQSVHKHFIISIYTAWETTIKEAVFSTYKEYKRVIIDQRFIRQYFSAVSEKKYVRDMFIENVNDNSIDITESTLCYSNNLSYSELTAMLKRVCFDISDLPIHFTDLDEIDGIVTRFKGLSFSPILSTMSYPKNRFEYFKAYLNTLIYSRNSVAHTYEVDSPFKLAELEVLLDFVELSTKIILEYLGSQIIKKGIENKVRTSIPLVPVDLYKAGRSPIVGVRNISLITLKSDMVYYIYDTHRSIYKHVTVLDMQISGKSVSKISPYVGFSMSLNSKKGIQAKQAKTFRICTLNHTLEPYEHIIKL